MGLYFSASRLGFFDSTLHSNLPADAVEVSQSRWQELLALQSAGKCIAADADGSPIPADPLPPVPVVPSAVTMRQARLALLAAGLLDDVEPALAALPQAQRRAAEIEWEFAATVERTSHLTAMLAEALGLDDEATDALFRAAAAL